MGEIVLNNPDGKEIRRLSVSECVSLNKMLSKMREAYDRHPYNVELVIVFRGTKNRAKKYYTETENEDFIIIPGEKDDIHVEISNAMDSFEHRFSEIDGFCAAPFHNHRQATTFGYDDICNLIDYDYMHEMFLDSHKFIFIVWKTPEFIELSKSDKKRHRKRIDELSKEISKRYFNDYLELMKEYDNISDIHKITSIHERFYNLSYKIKDELWEKMNVENDFNILSVRTPKSGIECYK